VYIAGKLDPRYLRRDDFPEPIPPVIPILYRFFPYVKAYLRNKFEDMINYYRIKIINID